MHSKFPPMPQNPDTFRGSQQPMPYDMKQSYPQTISGSIGGYGQQAFIDTKLQGSYGGMDFGQQKYGMDMNP